MRSLLGIAMIIGGVVLGLYVGGWVCFVGGIVDIVGQFRAPEVSGVAVGIALLKIFGASIAGAVSALFLVIPGAATLGIR